MAGHNHGTVAQDAAMEKYYHMTANRWKYFRWTPRTFWISFAWMVAVPTAIGYMGYKTDGKYNMRGKRRGDTIVDF